MIKNISSVKVTYLHDSREDERAEDSFQIKLKSGKVLPEKYYQKDKGSRKMHSQKALGSIILPIKFGALRTDVKYYVINADTSYKALLGRPWLHEYNVVPSTLH
ncbi:hypothetical protein ACMD2_20063 [Ananas comosus]|uniref:Reverse transcriptase/retrotransposon-derived protein RNase H-like domain-containing protein n=1 Tax=Ananas comosus TaxID=4615 RepID=A0A199VWC5_ANACO|nr:hypothetical protein ACMD2_20063 [Ananas comosus]